MDAINAAMSRWGIELKHSTRCEYVGPCPFCMQGDDRFHVWTDRSNYWCRVCGKKGFLDDGKKIDPIETRIKQLEWQQKRADIERREMQKRLTALERMSKCKDHLQYHYNCPEIASEYWQSEGIIKASIKKYLLGYCQSCPTAPGVASYTIPIINDGILKNIRHRLANDYKKGGRYRPHMAGLGTQLFNADKLDGNGKILIVEGEKKSIVLDQFGFDAVAICGKRQFRQEWLSWFLGKEVIVALDPDATESAYRLAGMFERGKVASLPCKIDDMLVKFGAKPEHLSNFLSLARPV